MLNVPDVGAAELLEIVFNNSRPAGGNNLTLKLFCNNTALSDSDTSATFTEASGGGYAAITLTNGSWTVAGDGSSIETASYAEQTWTFTGALTTNTTVYGYYVVDADDTLIFAELFDSGVTPATSGNYISVTPKFQASKGTPS